MDTKKYHPLLVSLLCVALGACSSTDKNSAMNNTGAAATPTAMPASPADSASSNSAMTWNGVVQNIEMMPRSAVSGSSTDGASGGSGTASATGAQNDMVYRVTLRMDDGSTKMATQDTQPSFQIGDKVRMSNGMLQAY